MTVSELIEDLQKYPSDTPVFVFDCCGSPRSRPANPELTPNLYRYDDGEVGGPVRDDLIETQQKQGRKFFTGLYL